jgi:ATP-dependent RNA helicase DDX54/DBP10
MFPQKRKQTAANEVFFYMGNSAVDKADSDHEVDIASALTRKNDPAGENSDDELARIIQNSIARRDVKAGTEVLKQVKGKAKMGKGEVGGGSFQCMGK